LLLKERSWVLYIFYFQLMSDVACCQLLLVLRGIPAASSIHARRMSIRFSFVVVVVLRTWLLSYLSSGLKTAYSTDLHRENEQGAYVSYRWRTCY